MNIIVQELLHTRQMFEEDLMRAQHEIMEHYQIMLTLPQDILEADINLFIPVDVCQDILENPDKASHLYHLVNGAYLRLNQDILEEKEDEVENQDPNSQTPEKVQVQQRQPTPPRPRHLPLDAQKLQNKKQLITKKFKK